VPDDRAPAIVDPPLGRRRAHSTSDAKRSEVLLVDDEMCLTRSSVIGEELNDEAHRPADDTSPR
jgi:hypothetical protein